MVRKSNNSRANQKAEVRVPFPMLLANVLVAVAVLGLSYIWLCARCDALGKQIKQAEVELERAQKQTRMEQERWAALTTPSKLRAAINRFDLDMVMPSDSQIVKLGRWSSQGKTAMLGGEQLWVE